MKKIILVLTVCIAFFSTATSMFAAEDTWESKANILRKSDRVSLVSTNGKIYLVGGHDAKNYYDSIDEYDPTTDSWTKVGTMPTKKGTVSAAVYNGEIYILGGEPINNKLDIFNLETKQWRQGTSFPKNVAGYSAQFINGKLLVIGGFNIYNNASAETYEYNPVTNTWSQKASLNVGRRYITSAVLNEKVYAIGGIGGAGPEILSSVEVYDPMNDTWTVTSSMPSERYGLSSAVINNEIYVMGGVTKPSESAGPASAEVNKYDPITETWSTVTPLTFPRGLLSAVSLNNEIYVAGGSNDPNYYSNFEKYSVKDVEVPPTQPEEPSAPEPETPNVGDRAILVVTMVNGLEKEYDLSISEINKFLSWYDTKDGGSGPSKFAIDKHKNNIGPFSNRTDYVIFNNILTFEINKYTN